MLSPWQQRTVQISYRLKNNGWWAADLGWFYFYFLLFLLKEGADPDSLSGTEFQTGPSGISPAQPAHPAQPMCRWREADAAAAGASVSISLNIHHLQVRTAGGKPIRLELFYLQNKPQLLVWVFGESRKRTMMCTMANKWRKTERGDANEE